MYNMYAAVASYLLYMLIFQVVYTVGAVVTFYELYNSVTKVAELTKKLQRLKDSSGETSILYLLQQPTKNSFYRSVQVRRSS